MYELSIKNCEQLLSLFFTKLSFYKMLPHFNEKNNFRFVFNDHENIQILALAVTTSWSHTAVSTRLFGGVPLAQCGL